MIIFPWKQVKVTLFLKHLNIHTLTDSILMMHQIRSDWLTNIYDVLQIIIHCFALTLERKHMWYKSSSTCHTKQPIFPEGGLFITTQRLKYFTTLLDRKTPLTWTHVSLSYSISQWCQTTDDNYLNCIFNCKASCCRANRMFDSASARPRPAHTPPFSDWLSV